MASKLTDKQKRFAYEYLVDLNATQAAIRAGYSRKTAKSQGQRLLTNVYVQDCIQRRQKELREKTEITQEKIIAEMVKIGFATTTDFAVNGAPIVEGAEHKTSSKLKALELIGKTLGMFDKPPDSNDGENADLASTIEAAYRRRGNNVDD